MFNTRIYVRYSLITPVKKVHVLSFISHFEKKKKDEFVLDLKKTILQRLHMFLRTSLCWWNDTSYWNCDILSVITSYNQNICHYCACKKFEEKQIYLKLFHYFPRQEVKILYFKLQTCKICGEFPQWEVLMWILKFLLT